MLASLKILQFMAFEDLIRFFFIQRNTAPGALRSGECTPELRYDHEYRPVMSVTPEPIPRRDSELEDGLRLALAKMTGRCEQCPE